MNKEQMAALSERERDDLFAWLTEVDETDAYANRLAAERDQYREDIRRLVKALAWVMTGYDLPSPEMAHDFDWVGWEQRARPLLAEMKERYDV